MFNRVIWMLLSPVRLVLLFGFILMYVSALLIEKVTYGTTEAGKAMLKWEQEHPWLIWWPAKRMTV